MPRSKQNDSSGSSFRYTVEIVSPEPDISRLQQRLEAAFSASDARIVSRKPVAESGNQPDNIIRRQLLEVLSNKTAWRMKHILTIMQNEFGRQQITRELYSLLELGFVVKFRHGIFGLVGTPPPADDEIPPLTSAARGTKAEKDIIPHLNKPISVVQLKELITVSRQRIDQILFRLENEGRIKRVNDPKHPNRSLWVRI